MTNKEILGLATQEYKINEKILIEARITGDWNRVKSCRGISWGRNKEIGNLYHAYCEFCGNLFEDGAKYKKECEQYAKQKGWIIGNTKETRDIAVCPKCKNNIKKKNNETNSN